MSRRTSTIFRNGRAGWERGVSVTTWGSRRSMFEDDSFCLVLKVDVRHRMARTSLYSVSACPRAF